MGQSVCKGKNCEDCSCCPITAENVHRVLLQAYGVVTDCKKSFEERKKILCCLRDKYKCFINPYFPDIFSFKKDCFGYEYFFLIATVKKYAVDLVLYWDLQDWVVLNSGSCYRHYYSGGCSKLDKSVALRKPCRGDFKRLYEAKKRQVNCILAKKCESSSSSSSCSSSSSSSSCSSSSSSSTCQKKKKCRKPEICIISPKNRSKVSCDFCLKFKVKHAKDHCLEWCWAGKKGGKVKEKNQVKIHLEEAKKGWHCVDLKLLDKCGKVVACKKMKFYLCKSCCHSSSSSSCSSSSSSSSCFVSLSGCDSSSSSSWCKKCKSSSCSCDSSSSSSWCKKCKSSSCSCDSSSSSSSWCKKCKSSSCSCDSSSSSSSWCKKCKSSSCSCDSSSSSSSSSCKKCKSSSCSCDSSSSSSSSCKNPYDKKYRVSCGNYGWDRKKYGSYTLKKRFNCSSSSSSSSSSCPSSSSSSSSRIYWKRRC